MMKNGNSNLSTSPKSFIDSSKIFKKLQTILFEVKNIKQELDIEKAALKDRLALTNQQVFGVFEKLYIMASDNIRNSQYQKKDISRLKEQLSYLQTINQEMGIQMKRTREMSNSMNSSLNYTSSIHRNSAQSDADSKSGTLLRRRGDLINVEKENLNGLNYDN